MSDIADFLKAPLEYCGTQILGKCQFVESDNPNVNGDLTSRTHAVAKAVFYTLLGVAMTPVWIVGDVIEWVSEGDQQFQDSISIQKKPLSEVAYDAEKTKYLGSSVSCYQSISHEGFCENSDWGKYVNKHFPKGSEKGHLAPGKGVDILTEEGRSEALKNLQDSNGNTIRFSVEWADILNPDGSFSEMSMQKYVQTAKFFKENGITPMICLHHFVTPLNEKGQNIFETEEGIQKFVDYAEFVYEHLFPYSQDFFTFNEANVDSVMNNVFGEFPSGRFFNFWMSGYVTRNKLEAHKRAYSKLHQLANEKSQDVFVGLTHQSLKFSATSRWNYAGRIASFVLTYAFHDSFMEWAEKNTNSLDRLGIQYYTMPLVGWAGSVTREGGKMVESMDFRFFPEGIHTLLTEVNQRLRSEVPLIITERGTAGKNIVKAETLEEQKALDEMDSRREEYAILSSQAIRKAQDEGVNVEGILEWGLDGGNFEWAHGFDPEGGTDFGLKARNPETKESRPTKGFEAVSQINGNTLAIIHEKETAS